MSRQYSRVFISLKQDRAGYDFKGKEPSGRCVIEAKSGVSKLTVYIQDIKPEILYKAYIISSNHSMSEGVPIGTLNTDAKGKAELKWEFDADNVCGTGKAIEKFNVVAVIISAKNELISPLVGYRDNITTWKNNFLVFSQEQNERAEAKDTAEKAAVEVIAEEIENEIITKVVEEEIKEEDINEVEIEAVEAEEELKTEEINEVEIEAAEAEEELKAEEINEAEIEITETEEEIKAEEINEAEIEITEADEEIKTEEIIEAEIEVTEAEEEINAEEINEVEIEVTETEEEIKAEEIEEAEIEITEADEEIKTEETVEADAVPEEAPIEVSKIEPEEKKFSTPDDFFEPVSSVKEDFIELLNKELEEAEIEAEKQNDIQTVENEQPDELTAQSEAEPEQTAEQEPSPTGESKPDIHATFLEMAKNFNRELRELEQITFVKPDDIESAGISEPDVTPEPETNSETDTTGVPISDGIVDMFRNNPPMRPFQKQNIDVSWIRISMREIIFLPLDHWKYMNHSFFVSAYNRFRHLILGKYEENGEDKYFLGVPEIYDSIYKKSAMSLGFTQFKCCEDVRTINGEYGYWIMPL